jgi:hypothetical protein
MGAGAPATGVADTASGPAVRATTTAARIHRTPERGVTSYHLLHRQATSADDTAGQYTLTEVHDSRTASRSLARGPRTPHCVITALLRNLFAWVVGCGRVRAT